METIGLASAERKARMRLLFQRACGSLDEGGVGEKEMEG